MAALRLSKAYKDTRPHGVVIIDLWGYKTGYACISVFPFLDTRDAFCYAFNFLVH